MSLSHLPHGLFATPSLGGSVAGSLARYPGLWTQRIFFVDADHGSNGNTGLEPTKAKATIQAAVNAAGVDDTIYIRPQAETQGWSDLDPRYGSYRATYIENVNVVRFTKAGLSIIGTGNGWGTSGGSVTMVGAAAQDCTIDVHAAFVNIENIQFGWRAQQTNQTGTVIRLINGQTLDDTASHSAFGDTVSNCWFDRSGNVWGAILIASSAGHLIENCTFDNCNVGVYLDSSDTTPDGVFIRGNTWFGTASNTTVCIVMADVDDICIERNIFAHTCPSKGSPNKYVSVAGTAYGSYFGNIVGSTQTAVATDHSLNNLSSGGNMGKTGSFLT